MYDQLFTMTIQIFFTANYGLYFHLGRTAGSASQEFSAVHFICLAFHQHFSFFVCCYNSVCIIILPHYYTTPDRYMLGYNYNCYNLQCIIYMY